MTLIMEQRLYHMYKVHRDTPSESLVLYIFAKHVTAQEQS